MRFRLVPKSSTLFSLRPTYRDEFGTAGVRLLCWSWRLLPVAKRHLKCVVRC